jgi:HPr kinase/phosphorylase
MAKTTLCPPEGVQLHASCVAIGAAGVLLLGASGSGKSDLSARLIDSGATLVADDRVNLVAQGGQLLASVPHSIAGKLELRGVGIIDMPYAKETALKLAVTLDNWGEQERLPEPAFFDCLGLRVPLLSVQPFEDSACAKIRLFLQYGC